MRYVVLPALAALLFLGACSTNNGMAARDMATEETPSGGLVPGQMPE